MTGNDRGFSTPLAMTVILSLSLVSVSLAMHAAADERRLLSYRNTVAARKEADGILYAMERNLQELKNCPCDFAGGFQVQCLAEPVCGGSVSARDVSTGIKKEFFSESFCENKSIRKYMSENETEASAEYGWISSKLASKKMLEYFFAAFGNEKPFPLVNSFPLFNVYCMSQDFIKAVLEYSAIKNADEKSRILKERLSGETTVKEMADILGVKESHPVFSLIGTKTMFWEVDFETEKCMVSAVFAAVPERNKQLEIEKYILVDKDISFKGGAPWQQKNS